MESLPQYAEVTTWEEYVSYLTGDTCHNHFNMKLAVSSKLRVFPLVLTPSEYASRQTIQQMVISEHRKGFDPASDRFTSSCEPVVQSQSKKRKHPASTFDAMETQLLKEVEEETKLEAIGPNSTQQHKHVLVAPPPVEPPAESFTLDQPGQEKIHARKLPPKRKLTASTENQKLYQVARRMVSLSSLGQKPKVKPLDPGDVCLPQFLDAGGAHQHRLAVLLNVVIVPSKKLDRYVLSLWVAPDITTTLPEDLFEMYRNKMDLRQYLTEQRFTEFQRGSTAVVTYTNKQTAQGYSQFKFMPHTVHYGLSLQDCRKKRLTFQNRDSW